jgi:hypothetical protein
VEILFAGQNASGIQNSLGCQFRFCQFCARHFLKYGAADQGIVALRKDSYAG